jgi:hypothetical protein
MKKSLLIGLAMLTILLGFTLPASAAPHAQPTTFPTPTPGPDGRIVYIVQAGDTLWRISAVSGIKLDDLRALNGLSANDVIAPGDQIFLGLGGPSSFTPTPKAVFTPTPIGPTPTPEIGYGTLCVILYQDINGDAVRQEEEPSLPGGALSISNPDGSISITEDTVGGLEHFCVDDLQAGSYTITAAIPDGYNPTTVLSTTTTLKGGDQSYLGFGAQANAKTLAEAPIPAGSGKSPLLGILGGLFVLLGIGLGVYALLLKK